MIRPTTTITRLQRGETLHMPLDAHTTLQVAAGEVIVREPLRWLGDTVVAPVVTLTEGRSHRPVSALQALYTACQTLWRRATPGLPPYRQGNRMTDPTRQAIADRLRPSPATASRAKSASADNPQGDILPAFRGGAALNADPSGFDKTRKFPSS